MVRAWALVATWCLVARDAVGQRGQRGRAKPKSGLGRRSAVNQPRRPRSQPEEGVDPQGIGALVEPRGCVTPPPATPAATCARARAYDRTYGDGDALESVAAVIAAAGVNASHRPTIVVLGAGHSGTSTVTAEILALGYRQLTRTPGFERHFTEKHEDGFVVRANDLYLRRAKVDRVNVAADPALLAAAVDANYALGRCVVSDHARLRRRWATYPRPGVLKDPRFVWTLHLWPDLFADEAPPLLVHVRRDPAAIVRSHEARGEIAFANLAMGLEDAVASRVAWAEWQFSRWCGPKVSFSLHALKHAAHANKFKKLRVG